MSQPNVNVEEKADGVEVDITSSDPTIVQNKPFDQKER